MNTTTLPRFMASIDDHRRARIVDMDPTPRQKPDRSILRALETRMGGEEFHLKIAHPTATTANLKTARGDVTAQPSPRNRWSPSAWMPRTPNAEGVDGRQPGRVRTEDSVERSDPS
ncbi:hypothetical protein GW17_00040305 [Ensete ventricosum]|nr:hypothetical protein GW17_00040305 [Ensete ventricosum]